MAFKLQPLNSMLLSYLMFKNQIFHLTALKKLFLFLFFFLVLKRETNFFHPLSGWEACCLFLAFHLPCECVQFYSYLMNYSSWIREERELNERKVRRAPKMKIEWEKIIKDTHWKGCFWVNSPMLTWFLRFFYAFHLTFFMHLKKGFLKEAKNSIIIMLQYLLQTVKNAVPEQKKNFRKLWFCSSEA